MNIGSLNHRIEIQQESRVSDGMGGATKTWATIHTVSARVEPLQGREFFAAQQTQSSVTHKVTIWYQPGITSRNRIMFGSRIFDITSVINPGEQNISILIMCVERQP